MRTDTTILSLTSRTNKRLPVTMTVSACVRFVKDGANWDVAPTIITGQWINQLCRNMKGFHGYISTQCVLFNCTENCITGRFCSQKPRNIRCCVDGPAENHF